VNLLLDTHVFLWTLADPVRLGPDVRARIVSPVHRVFVSAVTGWEIEIKRSLGKLSAPDDLDLEIEKRGMTHLPLHMRHARALRDLPPVHADPFDRMLVAQCKIEGLTLITADQVLAGYDIPLIRI
jgi:PIN domain nuclease of toxin-antitoxin system